MIQGGDAAIPAQKTKKISFEHEPGLYQCNCTSTSHTASQVSREGRCLHQNGDTFV